MNPETPQPPSQSVPRLLKLAPDDNVAVAATAIPAGQTLPWEGRTLRFAAAIPAGHKVALVRIAAGEKVRKYGAPIGSATCAIEPGEHVHTQNLKSDYF
jgi:altronate dehydratase